MNELFHKHSTFFGLLASACLTCAIGGLTRWNALAMAVACICGLSIFPRAFYGIKDARDPDADKTPRTGRNFDLGYGTQGFWSDTDAEENAYLESRLQGYNPDGTPSDPDALRKLTQQEEGH
jgi:hypothetical protein